MALASAARSEPGGCPPAASISSWAGSVMPLALPVHEGQVFRESGEVEQALDPGVAGDERELEAVALRFVVPARHERQPRRVHEVEPPQVDDDAAWAALAHRHQALLERPRRAHVEVAVRHDARDVRVALDLTAK